MGNHSVCVKCAIEAVAGHSCQLAAAAAGGVAQIQIQVSRNLIQRKSILKYKFNA